MARIDDNVTAKQLVAKDLLGPSLIGATVMVTKGDEIFCGTLQYFWSKESPVYKSVTSSKKSGTKTTVMFIFESGARMEFESIADDVNIEILYPATAS